ncbi:MAG: M42 family peptidase, partial [Candidatus Poribacteria bacterium]
MLIEKLSNAFGVSGNEKDIRQVIKDEVTPLVDEVKTDSMGNLFAIKKGDSDSLKIMLSAHMDEV